MATRPGSRRRAHERPTTPSGPDPDREAQQRVAHVFGDTFAWFLSPVRLRAKAEDLRILRRQNKLDVGLVTVSVVLAALSRSSDGHGRVLDAYAVYRQLGGAGDSKEGFRLRLMQCADLLLALLKERLAQLASGALPALRGRLAHFTDLLIPDGTVFKLATALCDALPGSGSRAALKLHAVYSVRARAAVEVSATAGKEHDNPHFTPAWVRGALYLWDLGYNDYGRVIDALEAGAHLVQRLKDNGNPVALASYSAAGHRRALRGEDGAPMRLDEACAFGHVHKGEVLDLDVEIASGRRRAVVRVVCVPVDGQDRYYLTTLPRESFTPYDVAELYACRWEVELLFKDWQGGARLDEVQTLTNLDTLRATVYGALLASLLARDLALAAEGDPPADEGCVARDTRGAQSPDRLAPATRAAEAFSP